MMEFGAQPLAELYKWMVRSHTTLQMIEQHLELAVCTNA